MQIIMRISTLLLLIFTPSISFGTPAHWITSPVKFIETDSGTENPDRGMFKQVKLINTFKANEIDPKTKNLRIYFVMNQLIRTSISEANLSDLNATLSGLERNNQRAILRFIYDYPSDELVRAGLKSRSALTASPALMSVHIRQLSKIIAAHKRAVYAIESGLIGFWGEQHGDTPDKQTPQGIASIINQWRTALSGTEIQILARYPKTMRAYALQHPDILTRQPRFGYWNDCMGAFDDDNMAQGAVPVVEGETCVLPPRTDYSCSTMEPYFKKINLNLLHSEYFAPTIARWKVDGCLGEIERKLGYRLVIKSLRLASDGSELYLQISNAGWGQSNISRPLYLMANGRIIKQIADLEDFKPGLTRDIHISLTKNLNLLKDNLSPKTVDNVIFSNIEGNTIYYPLHNRSS